MNSSYTNIQHYNEVKRIHTVTAFQESLRICLLPTILSYDAPWPVRKVPLRCTPHYIVYHMETKTYCVVTSNSEPTLDIWKLNGDDKVRYQAATF